MGEPTPESPRANPSVERLDDHASLEKNELVEAEPPNPNNSPSPPLSDGGLQGWLQCLGAFFMFFNSWGIVNTFGVYQTYYEQHILRDESPSKISWIGSLQAFFFLFGGILAGPLYDHGYLRSLICVGSFLIVFGMMMTSLSSTYWQFILAQGLVVGVGNGCLFVPSIAVLPTYFTKRRALVTGIAITGGNLGGIIYPIVFERLQHLGFRWATRIIAFIMLITLFVPITLMRMRIKPSIARRLFDFNAWTEPAFITFACAGFCGSIGLYIPYFYVQTYSLEHGIVARGSLFVYLVSLINAGSVFGRILLAYAADKLGPVNILILTSLGSAIFAFIWIGIHTIAGLILFCLFYGFFSGAFISLSLNVIAAALCPHMSVLGVRMGMICFPTAIGFLIGNPIGGAILKDSWIGLQIFCGGAMVLATLGVSVVKIMKVGTDFQAKC